MNKTATFSELENQADHILQQVNRLNKKRGFFLMQKDMLHTLLADQNNDITERAKLNCAMGFLNNQLDSIERQLKDLLTQSEIVLANMRDFVNLNTYYDIDKGEIN